jgi:hypothetical protein
LYLLRKIISFKRLLVICIVFLLIIIFYTPIGFIRSQLFLTDPIRSFTCSIKKTDFIDASYGQQYVIRGFEGEKMPNGIHFAYIKRNLVGGCYWAGGGSGP